MSEDVFITIGCRCQDTVGAGSVVTKDVPANTIVGGVPAKLIRATGFGAPSELSTHFCCAGTGR